MPATTAEQYKPDEIRAIKLIQRFWRFWYPKLQRRQTYLQTPEAQAINHYIALGSANHAELSIRALLVSKGIDLYLKLANMRSSLFQHQKDVMSCTEIAELTIKSYESLDNALQQANGVDRSLKNATQNISDAHLTKLIMEGGLEKIQIVLEGVSDAIEDAENELWEIGKIVDDMRG
ncbi:hypothetical protein MMC28_009134 [Mycoblastus sanguinarius]|nr:hypothetical protein [Mycoblastus sanguinarius]